LPQWYADAKLGIFIHWGFTLCRMGGGRSAQGNTARDEAKWNAYAEWYYNTMRIPGSPTEAYHREHFGANFNYYISAPIFDGKARSGIREDGRRLQRRGRALRVLTSKHHEGFTLWRVRWRT